MWSPLLRSWRMLLLPACVQASMSSGHGGEAVMPTRAERHTGGAISCHVLRPHLHIHRTLAFAIFHGLCETAEVPSRHKTNQSPSCVFIPSLPSDHPSGYGEARLITAIEPVCSWGMTRTGLTVSHEQRGVES